MSAAPDISPDELLAAEWALGLLDAEEARAVEERRLRDEAFSRRCDNWAEHAAALLDGEDVLPSTHIWQRIAARLPANDMAEQQQRLRRSRGRWRALALGMTALVGPLGALTFTSLHQPSPPKVTAAPQHSVPIVVVLTGDKSPVIVSVSIDQDTGLITAASKDLDLGGHSAQLWLIPPGQSPRSLGLLPDARSVDHRSFHAAVQSIAAGMTLAISLEPLGGSRTGQPTGPVVATGSV